MSDENKKEFKFSYYAPSELERKTIESIRSEYQPKTEKQSKFEKLKLLDKKVKLLPKIISICVGVVGILIFGLGMSIALVWQIMTWGVVVSVLGTFLMLLAYPLNKKLLKIAKAKFSNEILALSEDLLNANK